MSFTKGYKYPVYRVNTRIYAHWHIDIHLECNREEFWRNDKISIKEVINTLYIGQML